MAGKRDHNEIPRRVEQAISTPHEHENEKRPPVWLVWRDRGDGDGWYLYVVCSSPEMARCNYLAALQTWVKDSGLRAHVERIPLDHAFASSLYDIIEQERRLGIRRPGGHPLYRREGD